MWELDKTISQSKNTGKEKTLTDQPLVSIVTPVFNGAKYLEECLQSVLKQTYPHIEHIVIDGGSSDGTLDILKDYTAQHIKTIKEFRENKKNSTF
mgnify:CR=1 FL=1